MVDPGTPGGTEGALGFDDPHTADPGTPGGTVITDQATASSAAPDPNPANNSATTTTTVSGPSAPGAPNPWAAGETGAYEDPLQGEHDTKDP